MYLILLIMWLIVTAATLLLNLVAGKAEREKSGKMTAWDNTARPEFLKKAFRPQPVPVQEKGGAHE